MKHIILLSIFIILSGCATITSGGNAPLHTRVIDENNEMLQQVSCIITDSDGGSYFIGSNPGATMVPKRGSIIISCKKENYDQFSIATGKNFNSMTIANVLFWPGFIVDAATGAYSSHPSHYIIMMKKR